MTAIEAGEAIVTGAVKIAAGSAGFGPIATACIPDAAPGSGYAVGDTGLISGDSGDATYTVVEVDGGGEVLRISLDSGTAYHTGLGRATSVTTGAGNGALTFNITAIGDGGLRIWGGYGPIEIGGEIYEGIGARGLAQQNAGAIGGVAQGMTLSLSGLEPVVLELLDSEEIKAAPVVLFRLIFAGDGKTLLDAHVFDRGRVDTVDSDETIGGEAAIMVAVESAARGLGRSGARRRSDSDQRMIDPDDGYFKHTAYAGQKVLYWGGKKPNRG